MIYFLICHNYDLLHIKSVETEKEYDAFSAGYHYGTSQYAGDEEQLLRKSDLKYLEEEVLNGVEDAAKGVDLIKRHLCS